VEKRVRKVLLTYDTIEDFIESMKDISNLGFDFAKYEDELKAFIQEKYEAGNYCIERDGYLFICTEKRGLERQGYKYEYSSFIGYTCKLHSF